MCIRCVGVISAQTALNVSLHKTAAPGMERTNTTHRKSLFHALCQIASVSFSKQGCEEKRLKEKSDFPFINK
jgi:hypothetical protein